MNHYWLCCYWTNYCWWHCHRSLSRYSRYSPSNAYLMSFNFHNLHEIFTALLIISFHRQAWTSVEKELKLQRSLSQVTFVRFWLWHVHNVKSRTKNFSSHFMSTSSVLLTFRFGHGMMLSECRSVRCTVCAEKAQRQATRRQSHKSFLCLHSSGSSNERSRRHINVDACYLCTQNIPEGNL